MPNSYFQFKQFRVEQGKTAMKVTTEACLLGAWTADLGLHPHHILDIGTGTGLLALMLAQQYPCDIDAVEIQEEAARQAASNFHQSPWSHRLHLIQADIRSFANQTEKTYDLILSNPPFFAGHLATSNPARQQSLHQDQLSLAQLTSVVDKLLSPEGRLVVLYPIQESAQFSVLMEKNGYQISRQLTIQDRADQPPIRQLTVFQRSQTVNFKEENLVIKQADQMYTIDFVRLLKDYYLYL